MTKKEAAAAEPQTMPDPGPVMHVDHSPHISTSSFTTHRMMTDVLIALMPAVAMSIYMFRWDAVRQITLCVAACLVSEFLFVRMRRQALTLSDFSAAVTGLILALSMPGTAPWYASVIASAAAVGLGKTIFGGLGMNIFNPAMVGRAFVMISFAGVMGAGAYESAGAVVDAVSQATPMNTFKQAGAMAPWTDLFWGMTNGSLGETSAAACLIGGLFLCLRKTAAWEIPLGVILAVVVLAGSADLAGHYGGRLLVQHLLGGALLFGAFFIATDPVTSPLSGKGKFIFGAGVGTLVMFIRIFSGYPEGVMFAVLLMNAVTPLINRWTIPRTMGEGF